MLFTNPRYQSLSPEDFDAGADGPISYRLFFHVANAPLMLIQFRDADSDDGTAEGESATIIVTAAETENLFRRRLKRHVIAIQMLVYDKVTRAWTICSVRLMLRCAPLESDPTNILMFLREKPGAWSITGERITENWDADLRPLWESSEVQI